MIAPLAAPGSVDAFEASMRAFHPVGFRAIARASAENVRDALPHIEVPEEFNAAVHGFLRERERP